MTVTGLERDEIIAIAEAIDLDPDPALGQYFIGDAGVARRIGSACGVARGDHVLEVGSGMGALTLELLHLGARVTAIDVDLALARQLPKTVTSHTDSEICGLTVLARDVFELRPSDVPKGPSIAFVSLPRDVTTDGVLHVLTEFPSLRTIVAVVESMVDHWENSTPGSPGYDVAVARLRYLADMRHDGPLPASAFWPLPPRAPDLIRLDRLD